ncbi:hypothetical protein CRG98_008748 [Punica granatum]|uniref:Uncharacterized protein n=1 Tax=Punica granatum TaxID=22663 RepID=A0A2I0KQW4_PUNGR|nr:hypothetical protein CRG98_008748 [Punica granatum]
MARLVLGSLYRGVGTSQVACQLSQQTDDGILLGLNREDYQGYTCVRVLTGNVLNNSCSTPKSDDPRFGATGNHGPVTYKYK